MKTQEVDEELAKAIFDCLIDNNADSPPTTSENEDWNNLDEMTREYYRVVVKSLLGCHRDTLIKALEIERS